MLGRLDFPLGLRWRLVSHTQHLTHYLARAEPAVAAKTQEREASREIGWLIFGRLGVML